MKPERISPRTSKIPARINGSRWAAYAAAGAATTFAYANSAEAGTITYSGPVDRPFNAAPGGSQLSYFQLDKVGDSFLLQFKRRSSPPSHGSAIAGIQGLLSAGIAGFATTVGGKNYAYASKLAFGQNISGRRFVGGTKSYPVYLAAGNGFPNSQWLAAGTGFLGFKFNGGTGVEYGWARITMNGTPGNTFTLVDYAFGSPGQNVSAGQTSVPDSGGSLGLLAIGAAGLLALRQWAKARGAQ